VEFRDPKRASAFFFWFFEASINAEAIVRADLLIGEEEDINGIATISIMQKCVDVESCLNTCSVDPTTFLISLISSANRVKRLGLSP
jgi:hypothetical protein